MITKRTVLVLGAGASSHYGFPLGEGLRDRVCGLANDNVLVIRGEHVRNSNDDIELVATVAQPRRLPVESTRSKPAPVWGYRR